jgi:hypothetical protein
MLDVSPIFSMAIPSARIERGRAVAEPSAELPALSLGLGPYTACDLGDGRAQLYDAAGYAWGVFASVALATATAAALSR